MTVETTHGNSPRSGDAARPLDVGMLLFEGHTTLDFVGPHLAFSSAGMRVHLVSDSLAPVASDIGLAVLPTATLEDCPADLDILFVPGGSVHEVLLDQAKIDFLVDRGRTASYITSVCTGSLVLAAAGLLDGYRAATHWATRAQLARFGVEVSYERVCVDRNRATGGGVTAGIDFALTLIARVLGEDAAKLSQLAMEYTPQPPFDAGSPESAGAEVVARFAQFADAAFGGSIDEGLGRAVSDAVERRAALTS
ncbi:DJ-1/PfpI family protein [Streptomyces hygroscopicus]|uniref:DJ-1/PfpI family protein n=1 Tax=Streptomyces hygroscopicus TaxID=1912 RepID=UPI00068FF3CC|nr:DJ-1/PfpI family protein [Streptomyces hygroscopicus]